MWFSAAKALGLARRYCQETRGGRPCVHVARFSLLRSLWFLRSLCLSKKTRDVRVAVEPMIPKATSCWITSASGASHRPHVSI